MKTFWRSFGKFWRGVMSWFGFGMEKAANAVTDKTIQAKQSIDNRKESIDEFRKKLVNLKAQVNKDLQEAEELEKEKTKYTDLAKRAGKQGNRKDVEKIVTKLNRVENRYTSLMGIIDENQAIIAMLIMQLEDYTDDVLEDEGQLQRIEALHENEKLRASAAELSAQLLSEDSGLSALEKEVKDMKAHNDAAYEMSRDSMESIEDKYKSAPISDRVDSFMSSSVEDTNRSYGSYDAGSSSSSSSSYDSGSSSCDSGSCD